MVWAHIGHEMVSAFTAKTATGKQLRIRKNVDENFDWAARAYTLLPCEKKK